MKKTVLLSLIILSVIISSYVLWSSHISTEIEHFLEVQERSVQEKNKEKYMTTISPYNLEYLAEKESWFRDIKNNDVKDFKLTLKKIKTLSLRKIQVTVIQSYKYMDKTYKVEFPLLIIKEKGHWLDNDLSFKVINTNNFTIKYFKHSKKNADMIKSICEEAKSNIEGRYGSMINDNTTIKIYQNLEMLRQSVKLSFPWQFAGWYEYPESIKTSEFSTVESYRRVLEHELVHKLTLKESNNNLPYWFTEGLAVYFSDFHNDVNQVKSIEQYLKVYGEKPLDISKIESINLERLEKDSEISQYYDSAGLIVEYMAETYGVDGVKRMVQILGSYPYQKGTGSEIDEKSKERFHEVLPKAIGVNIDQLNNDWIKAAR